MLIISIDIYNIYTQFVVSKFVVSKHLYKKVIKKIIFLLQFNNWLFVNQSYSF